MSHMSPARTSDDLRAINRARLLRAVHDHSASLTRAQLTELLEMARGTASVLVAELTALGLCAETPAQQSGRGRPSRVPGPHPDGPVAAAVHLREDGWELAIGELGGATTTLGDFPHDDAPGVVFPAIGAELAACRRRYGKRLVGAAVSIAGPVRDGHLVYVHRPSWERIDVTPWLHRTGLPVELANDATMAAVAEARRGRLRGVDAALHLHVDFGIGGCLIHDGKPLTGTHGLAGEFGHMRLTNGHRPCECGATGCWGQEVGISALLRDHGGSTDYPTARDHAQRLLDSAASGDRKAIASVHRNVAALGAGIGSLVNAYDPGLVTISGIGAHYLASAPEALDRAYTASVMRYPGDAPPPLVAAALGRRGPLLGAVELVFDAFLTAEGVERYIAARSPR